MSLWTRTRSSPDYMKKAKTLDEMYHGATQNEALTSHGGAFCMAKLPLPPLLRGEKEAPLTNRLREGPSSSIGGYWHRP